MGETIMRVVLLALLGFGISGSAYAACQTACEISAARADQFVISGAKKTTFRPAKKRKPTAEDSEDARAKAARIKAWEEHCKPRIEIDKLGVSIYRYAHAGCEYGNIPSGALTKSSR